MADDIRLKVSEEKYQGTINDLNEKIDLLKNRYLPELRAKKDQIANSYTGTTAKKGIETIQKNEDNIVKAIEKLEQQRDKIQRYLDSLRGADSQILGEFGNAMTQASGIFS